MTNDEFIDESQQKHTGRRSRDRSDFVIPSCFVIIHLSLVFAFAVEVFSLSWQHAGAPRLTASPVSMNVGETITV
jgi:hypothetical protein